MIPVVTVDDAFDLVKKSSRDDTLIGGERGGVKVGEFDLGNSPREHTGDVVSGKRVILTITNGTKAFHDDLPEMVRLSEQGRTLI